jgi:hypothetical protein
MPITADPNHSTVGNSLIVDEPNGRDRRHLVALF